MAGVKGKSGRKPGPPTKRYHAVCDIELAGELDKIATRAKWSDGVTIVEAARMGVARLAKQHGLK